jgi:mitogen-activated protein kinase 7
MEYAALFDFDSFEMIESEYVLRQCIVDEVMRSKGINEYHASSSFLSSGSRRRYTGSSISTPSSTFTAEANQHAIHLAQAGGDVVLNNVQGNNLQYMVMNGQFVGEPEDMNEHDIQMMDSDESDIHVGRRRTLVGPADADFQDLERHLSREW